MSKKNPDKKIVDESSQKSANGDWVTFSLPCKLVRFVHPVPIRKNVEPVHELYIASETKQLENNKYLVDSLSYTPHGMVFEAHGQVNMVPLANIVYARPI